MKKIALCLGASVILLCSQGAFARLSFDEPSNCTGFNNNYAKFTCALYCNSRLDCSEGEPSGFRGRICDKIARVFDRFSGGEPMPCEVEEVTCPCLNFNYFGVPGSSILQTICPNEGYPPGSDHDFCSKAFQSGVRGIRPSVRGVFYDGYTSCTLHKNSGTFPYITIDYNQDAEKEGAACRMAIEQECGLPDVNDIVLFDCGLYQ